MSLREAYLNEYHAQMRTAAADLKEIGARLHAFDDEVKVELEEGHEIATDKMAVASAMFDRLGEATDDTWEVFKSGADDAWKALKEAVGHVLHVASKSGAAIPSALPEDGNQGEGNVTAARRYDAGVEATIARGDVEASARKAEKALDGAEGDALRQAEEAGKQARLPRATR